MKPIKYTTKDTIEINLGSKVIFKYPSPDKSMDIGLMVVKGRHPENKRTFILEHGCSFVMYVTKGNGIVYAGNEKFDVVVGDVVFVPKENKFAVDGEFEYITVDTPAFYPEQSDEIEVI